MPGYYKIRSRKKCKPGRVRSRKTKRCKKKSKRGRTRDRVTKKCRRKKKSGKKKKKKGGLTPRPRRKLPKVPPRPTTAFPEREYF